MSMAALAAPVGPVARAVSVYPVRARLRLRSPNVATPATAATVAVPESAAPPGFAPIARVTLPVNPLATLPCASRAVTRTAGVMTDPAVVVVGSTENASRVAAPGVTLHETLAPPVRPAPHPTNE